jgi:hypothetical protein
MIGLFERALALRSAYVLGGHGGARAPDDPSITLERTVQPSFWLGFHPWGAGETDP